MIKVKVSDILNSVSTFREIAKQSISGRQALQFARLIKKLDAENSTVQEQIKKLAEKYCERNEDGSVQETEAGLLIFKGDNKDAFSKEYQELIDVEVEINGVHEDWFDGVNIDADRMVPILPFLEQ